jgi:HD-GYP domain-containing protein (c-di-GMP phosphodiesterase class II)
MSDESFSQELILSILKTTEELNSLKDVDAILDKILYEARKIANADAGSIFLLEDESLKFSYVHNDTLFPDSEGQAELYSNFAVPVSKDSIVGYAALTGESIIIDDAYNIPADLPYSFNPSYDINSGYRTTSILTLPLKTFDARLVGVMQLINAKNENELSVPFSRASRLYIPLFANNAAVAIERGIMNRELILRMMKMAELRDPAETGAHVQRVGAYAAEIYHQWATKKKVAKEEIKRYRDLLRLAAMLHDVGKVGISDTILKKPGKLTDEEFDIMKWHTVHGARLFVNNTSDLDTMSKEIALFHHEKWAGGGYPGAVKDLMSDTPVMGEPQVGEAIPLAARITALADVFDALGSRRSYKDPWPDEKILAILEEESCRHFDPEIVEAFFEILDVIKAIRDKFSG